MSHFIQLPEFALDLLAEWACPSCYQTCSRHSVTAAGVRTTEQTEPCFFFEITCPNCKEKNITMVTSRPMDIHGLARMIMSEEFGGNDDTAPLLPLPPCLMPAK